MPRRAALSLSLLAAGASVATSLGAQVLGGRYAHAWLSASPSAQATALGGWQIRLDGDDPALAGFNPAALNANTHAVAHLSHDFGAGGVGRSVAAGGYHLDGLDADVAASVRFVGYGDLVGRDAAGNPEGAFNAREYAIGLAFAKTLNARVRAGAQLSYVGGSIAEFTSGGVAVSAGLTYSPDTAGATVWALQLQHAGYLWNRYTDRRDPLPAELSFGVSRRLRYLPLRVGVLYRRLDRWDLLYDDPERRESDGFFGDEPTERGAASEFVDNLARHFALNAELYLGRREVVQLRAGYDHQRQREGRVEQFRSLAGFSFGLGLNLRRVRVDYGRGVQHLAGGQNHVGLLLRF